jgi:adenylate cyclase
VALGRLDEARPYLDGLLQLDAKQFDPTHHLASVAYVDLAWAEGDARLAEEHASRAFSIASKSGSPYSLVYAQAARGLAHVVGGHMDAAIADLNEALSFARERRTGLEIEARIMADLSNAYRLRGDLSDAWNVASEALAVACARCARVPACLAHVVRAEVFLKRDGEVDLASSELAKARALIDETGAMIYEPVLSEIQACISYRRLFGNHRPVRPACSND